MYNRCMFLAHIRSHNQSIKNIDMASLSIEPLPKSLIQLGPSTEEDDCDNSSFSSGSTLNKSASNDTSSILISVNAPSGGIAQQTSTSTINKPVLSNSTAASNTSEKRPFSNTYRVVKTVPKLVPSDLCSVLINQINKTNELATNKTNNNEIEENVISGSDSDDGVDPGTNIHDISKAIEVTDGTPQKDSEVTVMDVDTAKGDLASASSNDRDKIPVVNCDQDKFESSGISVDAEFSTKNLTADLSKPDVSDSQVKTKSVKGKRKCPECGMVITARYSLRKHLQNTNRPGDASLKCNVCRLILPTRCALKMHLRIHMKLKPFRCPECAIEFHIFDRFLMHLKYTCCHLTKCIRYVCTLCGNMQVSLTALEQHLLTRHVRPIFKCGNCPVAFVNLKSVEKHKEKLHPGLKVETNAYQQCRLCPEKLIPKKRFLIHLKGHISDDRLCIYAYQCPTCKNTFFQRTELIYHRMQCDTREGIIKSVLSSPPGSPVCDKTSATDVFGETNDEEKEIALPCKKRKLVNDDEVEIIDDEQDPLSLEGFQAHEEPLREPLIELCVVCKKEKVVILPGKNQSSQSLCCKKCVRPFGAPKTKNSIKSVSDNKSKLQAAKLKCYKCKICASPYSMDLKSIYEHFKTYHKEFEGQSINEWLIIENKSQQVKRSSTITTAETIKEKYKKKKISLLNVQPISIKEEPNEDNFKEITAEKRKAKRFIKSKPKISEVKSFESGQIITSSETNTELNCSKCNFVAVSKEELRDHVTCHRTDPNALQCLECGECFVVLPSLEKHLIIKHSITDVDSYIDSNKQYIDGTAKKQEINEDEITKDSDDDFICKVCHETFESKTVLDKHFRSHGMAFLFKNLFP